MKIIVNNIATEYLDQGAGKIILMLHGWNDNLHTFDDICGLLQKDFRVVRLDLPGFGGTETPRNVWTTTDFADFVAAFIIKIKIAPDVILGHSHGGRVTIKGAATGVLNPRKIILMGSAGIARGKTLKNRLITVLAKIFGLLIYIPPFLFYRDKIRKKVYRMIGSDYLDAGAMKETFVNVVKEDLQSDAAKISIPTLIIWGEKDQQTPVSDGQKLHQLIKHSELRVIPGATHHVHQDEAAKVAKIIEDFAK